MIFGEIFYFVLLGVTAGVYWLVPHRLKTAVLASFGIGFYAYYAGWYVLLLAALTLGSWLLLFGPARSACGLAAPDSPAELESTAPPTAPPTVAGADEAAALEHGVLPDRAARALHLSSGARQVALGTIVLMVLVLGYFKYWGFLGQVLTGHRFAAVAAPLAISFFVFEFIHVAAERARGRLDHVPLLDYVAFIFFFPTMIAGPIKRYQQFSTGFETPRLTARDALEGTLRIIIGMIKKMVLADNLNTLITLAGKPSGGGNILLLTMAVVLYGFRIYLDFSGYSDIAIGSARLLGFRVPENFLHPYRQSNISAFWRHWHISLYSWLIDYVFIPLGGSRGRLGRVVFNILVVMLVSGIWHGAAWNFVLWGLWHGMLLAGHKVYSDTLKPRLNPGLVAGRPARAVSYLITMGAVWFGWLLFMWPLHEVRQFLAMWAHRL